MSTPTNNSCATPFFSNNKIEVSCSDIILLTMAAALIVIGSLWVAGIIPNGNTGIILPFLNFGAAAEGGTCIAIGAIATAGLLGKILSPNFRNS